MKVELIRDANAIGALIGRDLQDGIGGFGCTVPEALRAPAIQIEKEGCQFPELDPPPKLKRVK